MRYKLLAGRHYERDEAGHKLFTKGDIIESDRKLDEIYINKFERIVAPVVHVTEARREAVNNLIEFGKFQETDRQDLEGLSDSLFSRVTAQPEKQPYEKIKSPLGTDETENFPKALKEGFKVFKSPAGKFQITRGGKKPVNLQPLENADSVNSFIEQVLKEEGA